jgi:hypothetical protein
VAQEAVAGADPSVQYFEDAEMPLGTQLSTEPADAMRKLNRSLTPPLRSDEVARCR